jgi:hypothetical protein
MKYKLSFRSGSNSDSYVSLALREIVRVIRKGVLPEFASMVIAALVFVGFTDVGQASILEFDQIRIGGIVESTISGNDVELDYGDRITGSVVNVPGGQYTYGDGGEGFTPNIVVDFFAGSAIPNNPGVSLWRDGYGDLTNVLLGNNNSISLNVQFTADAGFDAQLYGFDLASWPTTDYTINAVNVLSGTKNLFSQNNVLVEGDGTGPGHTSFDFAALTGAELLIQIEYANLAGGQQDNIGIDNIRFGQNPPAAVPLPAAWLLFGSGMAAIALQRRRQSGSTNLR